MAVTTTSTSELSNEQINVLDFGQLRAEVKVRYERAADIEKRYPNGPITDPTDEIEVRRLLTTIDRLEDRLAPLEESETRKTRILANVERYNQAAGRRHMHASAAPLAPRSPGLQVLENTQYKALAESGAFRLPAAKNEFTVPMQDGMSLLQYKTLIWTGTGTPQGLVPPDIQPGVRVPFLTRELTILDLINTTPTVSDTIEYVAETAFTNAAAPVPQASATTGTSGSKPESGLTYQTLLSPVRTIAHWIPITNRMLADAPLLRGVIDQRLLLGLNLTLESQIITGDGTGENLTGLLNAVGINTTGVGTGNDLDGMFLGMTMIRVTGLSNPTAICLHPLDFLKIRLQREGTGATAGGYLMGPPSLVGATTLWGLPVVQSLGLPQGTGLVGDFAMGCMLFDREEGQIRVGFINDQFVRNIQTILAELRAAFVIWRATSFAKVTGL
ncbi:MAG TPA: phage major capsid protein [Methylomirabilota bacterium]|nr:phage major capsid protein [Methylomirabilota bacterium]